MSDFFVYAHRNSLKKLSGDERKIILVGSDFGYPNFGDILQLKSTIEFHQNTTGLIPIPVYALDSISSPQFIQSMQRHLDVDTILFISTEAVDVTTLDMTLVNEIRNVHTLHLYGGGFLNDIWGSYVLAVSEYFLQNASGAAYIISGQQIGVEIRAPLTNHIEKFTPAFFGVRDFDSLELLSKWNINGTYSFDDAYESLLKLAYQVPAAKEKRALGHLNFSSYTNDQSDDRISHVLNIFNHLRSEFPHHKLTLLNAYNDKRFAVCDSLSSVVATENDFPYKSYSVLDLVMAAYSGEIDAPELLAAELAVSCSYHVAMFLHLSGIPCWLISQNPFYHQKARALNGDWSFEEFICTPKIPDYTKRINARTAWKQELTSFFEQYKGLPVDIQFQDRPESISCKTFEYKSSGIKNMQDGLRWLEEQTISKDSNIAELLKDKKWLEEQVRNKDIHVAELERQVIELLSFKGWIRKKMRRKH